MEEKPIPKVKLIYSYVLRFKENRKLFRDQFTKELEKYPLNLNQLSVKSMSKKKSKTKKKDLEDAPLSGGEQGSPRLSKKVGSEKKKGKGKKNKNKGMEDEINNFEIFEEFLDEEDLNVEITLERLEQFYTDYGCPMRKLNEMIDPDFHIDLIIQAADSQNLPT